MTDVSKVAERHSPLVQLLMRFNRKERYWLLADILGEPFLSLSEEYRKRLSDTLGIEIPNYAWWALDYHFDWLYAALTFAPTFVAADKGVWPNEPAVEGRKIKGTQEDIDLIIAFDQTVILVEAKGVTGWTNAQMKSKTNRLCDLPIAEGVKTYLVLTSPKRSSGLERGEWVGQVPAAMMRPDGKYFHQQLQGLGRGVELLKVERCDTNGDADKDGECWHLVAQRVNEG